MKYFLKDHNYDAVSFLEVLCQKWNCSKENLRFDNPDKYTNNNLSGRLDIFFHGILYSVNQNSFSVTNAEKTMGWYCERIFIIGEKDDYVAFVSDFRQFIVYKAQEER